MEALQPLFTGRPAGLHQYMKLCTHCYVAKATPFFASTSASCSAHGRNHSLRIIFTQRPLLRSAKHKGPPVFGPAF